MTSMPADVMQSSRAEALPGPAVRPGHSARAMERSQSAHGRVRHAGHGETPAPSRSRLPRNLAGLTVVVVDDDDSSREYFATALAACGAAVETAASAMEALRLVEERRPHVVLSDIAMVGQDGYWLVREIRRLGDAEIRQVPVVATTAYGREHSRARILTAGFNELLQKPVDPELLCLTIASAAGR